MLPLPDLSYFAVPGFISSLRQRPCLTSSMLIYNSNNLAWEIALSENYADLCFWLNNHTGRLHDVYVAHTVESTFLTYNRDSIESFIRPAKARIITYLKDLGVEDVDTYMADSDEWLSVLFASQQEHYSASEIVANSLGRRIEELPMIIVWTSLDSRAVMLILPNKTDRSLKDYIKSIFWSLVTASRSLHEKGRLSIDNLKGEFLKQCNRSHYIMNHSCKIRGVFTIGLDDPISSILEQAGSHYARAFDTAISNFEEFIRENREHVKLISRFTNDTYRNIVSRLTANGFRRIRQGGNHEIWKHPNLDRVTPVPRHHRITPFVVKKIERDIRQATQA